MNLQDIVSNTTRFQDNRDVLIAEFYNCFNVVYEKNDGGVKYALVPFASRTRGFFANYHGYDLVTGEEQGFSGHNWNKVEEVLGNKVTILQELDDKTMEVYNKFNEHLGVKKIKTRNWSEALGGLGWSLSAPVLKPFVWAYRGLQRLTGATPEANLYDIPLVYVPIIFGSSVYQLVVPTQDFFSKIKNKRLLSKTPKSSNDIALNFTLCAENPNKFLGIEFILPDGIEVFHWHVNNGDERYGKGERYKNAHRYFSAPQELIDNAKNIFAEKEKINSDWKAFKERLKTANHEEFLKGERFLN